MNFYTLRSLIRSDLSEKELQLTQIAIGTYFVFGIGGAVCIDSNRVSIAVDMIVMW